MQIIKDILNELGYDSPDDMDIGETITIPGEPAFMDLTITTTGANNIVVAHYHYQNGDRMADPAIRFNTSTDDWFPYQYRQDPGMKEHGPDGINLHGFPEQWSENLRKQGFLDRIDDAEITSDTSQAWVQ